MDEFIYEAWSVLLSAIGLTAPAWGAALWVWWRDRVGGRGPHDDPHDGPPWGHQ